MCEYKLSVFLLNATYPRIFEQSLYAVQAAIAGLDAELIVVNNTFVEEQKGRLETLFPNVRIIEKKKDQPFFTISTVVKQRKSEYILFLDASTVIGEDSLRTLCYFMDEHPEIGRVGFKAMDGHGVLIPECKRGFPTVKNRFCRIIGLGKKYTSNSLTELNPEKEHTIDIPSEAFVFVRKKILDTLTTLPLKNKKETEDVALARAVFKAGYKNYYMPERLLVYTSDLRKVKVKKRRLLIICRENNFEDVKGAAIRRMPELEFVNLWDLDENRVMDAICRRNQMKGFTDIAFCYPDVRFEQILLFMDKMVNKSTIYHTYNIKNNRLVSADQLK